MHEQVDVCIIGGGVVGLFCAIEAIEAGKSVRVVDKTFIGATRNNIGELMQQGHHPDFLPLVTYAQKRWQQAEKSLQTALGLEVRGSVYLARSHGQLEHLRQLVADEQAAGHATQLIEDRGELIGLLGVSALSEEILGGRFSPDDMAIDTSVAMDALRRVAIAKGVRMWGDDEVTELLTDGQTVKGVRTRAGDECHATETIVAAGVWSVRLLQQLDLHLPMRPARCHLVEISPAHNVPKQLVAYPSRTGDIIAKYLNSGRVLMGYTGLYDQAQATWFNRVDRAAVSAMLSGFSNLMPCFQHATVRRTSTVSLAVTPDQKPYLGRPLNYNGLLVAIGFNGKSYAIAAGVAKVLADLITDTEPQVGLEPFALERFRKEVPAAAPRGELAPKSDEPEPEVVEEAPAESPVKEQQTPQDAGEVREVQVGEVTSDTDIGSFISK
ncbi:MAG: FAD-dependent oxidoreductase [Proteobacteria bacterium]|nr:FAD-dependent oxidoreductase [Pseudomonadota bacterium]